MSAHTKTHLTKKIQFLCIVSKGKYYELPLAILERYRVNRPSPKNKPVDAGEILQVSPEQAFADINAKYTKSGALLRAIRFREGVTQEKFAKMINVTQGDLSKIERGIRPIGKILSKRIAKKFGSRIE